MNHRTAPCPAAYTLSVIGGRWKVLILWKLFQGEHRACASRSNSKKATDNTVGETSRGAGEDI
jgi:DNA-binding HxlR family transcriptional regulator